MAKAINYNDRSVFPRFSSNETWYFDFDQDFYHKFNTFIVENPGMTAEEYADSIDFYKFTPKTIVKAFKLFNTYQCTFSKICGPFMVTNNRWYGKNKLNHYDNISMASEIKKLRSENEFLRKKIDEIVKNSMDF